MRDSGHRKKKSKYELHHHQLVEEKNVQIIYRIGLQITVVKVTKPITMFYIDRFGSFTLLRMAFLTQTQRGSVSPATLWIHYI